MRQRLISQYKVSGEHTNIVEQSVDDRGRHDKERDGGTERERGQHTECEVGEKPPCREEHCRAERERDVATGERPRDADDEKGEREKCPVALSERALDQRAWRICDDYES